MLYQKKKKARGTFYYICYTVWLNIFFKSLRDTGRNPLRCCVPWDKTREVWAILLAVFPHSSVTVNHPSFSLDLSFLICRNKVVASNVLWQV